MNKKPKKMKHHPTTAQTIAAAKYDISKDKINPDALYVIQKLQKNGFDAYIVGGGIRDILLGKTPKDFDIVTNATPEEVCKVFKRNSMMIGRRFKIVHVTFHNINPEKMVNNRPIIERHVLEVSTYRSAEVHQKSLNVHGKIMSDNNYGTQDEDAHRRDFTVNALYYDPVKEVIIDYHNGLQDIRALHLRLIGDPELRFSEDPVRMLRAIRLSVKLGLTIDTAIMEQFKATKELLLHEHSGRMYEEMLKFLLSGHAAACIRKLKKLDLPKGVFPLFDKLFFKSKPDPLGLNIIEKTDLRLQETSDISTVFILTGLLWSTIYTAWQKLLKNKKYSEHEALLEAIDNNKEFAYAIGVSRHTYSSISSVWLSQLDFENPVANRVKALTNRARFRQAWHLFGARHDLHQVSDTAYNWWKNYIEADGDEATQHELLSQLQ